MPLQPNIRTKIPPEAPRTLGDLGRKFAHRFEEANPVADFMHMLEGKTQAQRFFEIGKQFTPDPNFDATKYGPIINGHTDDWAYTLHSQSQEEADHLIKLIAAKRTENAMFNSPGAVGTVASIAGILANPLEAPLFLARGPISGAIAIGSLGVTEVIRQAASPELHAAESYVNMVGVTGLTFAAIKLQRYFARDGIPIDQSSGAAKSFDETAQVADDAASLGGRPTTQGATTGSDRAGLGPTIKVAPSQRVADRQGAVAYIRLREGQGGISTDVANEMVKFMEAVPDAFISGAAFLFREYGLTAKEIAARNAAQGVKTSSSVDGLYNQIYDLVIVFTGKNYPDPAGVLRHEAGHRVLDYFVDAAESARALKIYGGIPMGKEIDAAFLSRYPRNEQYKEWFAEGFNTYWKGVVDGTIPRAREGMAGIFEEVAGRLLETIAKVRGIALSEEQMVTNLFRDITRRGDAIDTKAFLAIARTTQAAAEKKIGVDWKPTHDLPPGGAASFSPGEKIKGAVKSPVAKEFELAPAKGLEKLGDSPMKRMAHPDASPQAKRLLPRLAEIPLFLKGNFAGKALGRGVDRLMAINWIAPMTQAMRTTEDLYKQYRVRMGAQTVHPVTAFDQPGTMNKVAFLKHVGQAKKALDDPARLANFEQEAIAAAREWDSKLYGPLGAAAKRMKMFSIEQRRNLTVLEKEHKSLDDVDRGFGLEGPDAIRFKELSDEIKVLKEEIKALDNIEIKPSFLNRIYDKNAVQDNYNQLFDLLLRYGRTRSEAKMAIEGILGQRALSAEEEILGHGREAVGRAHSLRTRTLDDIPDHELEFVLESNIFSVGNYYARRMGMDVELTREFRSIDLWDQLNAIRAYWDNKISRATKGTADKAVIPLSKAKTGEAFETTGFRGGGGGAKVKATVGKYGSQSAGGVGIYVANSFAGARQFGKDVMSLVVNAKNPLVIRSDDDLVKILGGMGVKNPETYFLEPWLKWKKKNNIRPKDPLGSFGGMQAFQKRQQQAFDDINAWARKQGHDAIIIDLGGSQKASKSVKEKLVGRSTIHRRFGQDQTIVLDEAIIKEVGLVQALPKKEISLMKKRRDQELEDVRAVRDRNRGTFGLPDDPNTWTSRTIRGGKMVNAMTLLTGALAQIPDVAMLPMVNGFRRTFGASLETLFDGVQNLKLSKADANLAGEALDMYHSTRAAIYADMGEIMGTTSTFERGLSKGTQLFFTASGMNPWNVGVKTLASLFAGSRIYDEALALSLGKANAGMIRRLARANINKETAAAIVAQFDQFGLKGNHVKIAKAGEWTDQAAKEAYLAALGKEINLTIITPGKAEIPNMLGGGLERLPGAKSRKQGRQSLRDEGVPLTPLQEIEDLFMGPGMSQLIFQFKTFTASASARILTPGLQAGDMDTLFGAVSLVALGGMVDAIRRHQLGIPDTGPVDRMWSAVERSAVLGYLGDIPGIMHSLVDPRFGMASKIGVFGGPIVQQGTNLGNVMLDTLSGNTDKGTVDSAVRLLPMNRVFFLNDQMRWLRDSGNEMVR